MYLNFLTSGCSEETAERGKFCLRCGGSGNLDLLICTECKEAESYMDQYRGYYPDEIISALINIDSCKRRIARLIEQERMGVELDVTVIFEIELKVHQVLNILRLIHNKVEPMKRMYIICSEIRDLINSRECKVATIG